MHLITETQSSSLARNPAFIAIGVFDGLHIGHQAVIRKTVTTAKKEGGVSVAATFDKHPTTVTAPDRVPLMIQTLEQRLRALASLGVDAIWLIQFDKAFSEKSPEEFVHEILKNFPGLRSVFVGEKFRFGRHRRGTVELLAKLGNQFGFSVEAVPSLNYDGEPVSSTRIRRLISSGKLDQAKALLGRPYTLSGKVSEGDKIGRQLGFPTANVATEGIVLPPRGVYAVHAVVESWSGPAVANIGFRPTFEHPQPVLRVEAHLIGFNDDIYGREIEITFLKRIRNERRFQNVDALRAQIAEDRRIAEEIHQQQWGVAGAVQPSGTTAGSKPS
ncbi:MAG: bifunctional riboflavin kinase/FAD synthetase [Verrucomicrobiae bacterium]|nr:bifunctional riboflavin kinase/FAD synthetase [Verrucomicrobiae bacterium]